jgi:hypothetical protein
MKNVNKIANEIVAQKTVDFRDYISKINFNVFTSSEMTQEAFGANLVLFYLDNFKSTDKEKRIIFQIDSILNNIKKGAKDQLKDLND